MLTISVLDLESQQTALLTPRNPPRKRWRTLFLSLHFLRSLSSRTSYYSAFSSFDDDTREADIVENLTESPESVNLDGENDNCIRDAEVQLQQAIIAKMVKEKDLDSIHKFGGIEGIAEALGTDLKKGIIHLRSRCIACTLSTTQTSALGFLQFLPNSCNNYTILLLFVCAVLSLGFGVKAEGLRTGWYEGVIIILAIIILVVIDSLRNQCQLKHSQRMSGKHYPFELQRMMVDVIRGEHLHKVIIGDVLIGDLVCLERDYIVPADGLIIDGSLILDDDLESTINEKNPFLFYGAKVINGEGRMLVASVGMNTRLGDLIEQVTHVPEKTPLPAQIDKVNKGTQIFGLSISILILVVLFLRFMLLKEDTKSSPPDLKEKPKAIKEIMDAIEKIVMKPNGKISTLMTSLATLLVGVMEGIPFVITLAISYWNKKMMSEYSEQVFAQEPFACLTMSSVTCICIEAADLCMPNSVPVGMEIGALKNAGFNIILVSQDNVSVLETIALRCGLPPCSNAMVLEEFQKFMNIAGLLITSITTMFCGYSPITPIQLLWANFVVSLLGGIGLLTEPPTEELMKKLWLMEVRVSENSEHTPLM